MTAQFRVTRAGRLYFGPSENDYFLLPRHDHAQRVEIVRPGLVMIYGNGTEYELAYDPDDISGTARIRLVRDGLPHRAAS